MRTSLLAASLAAALAASPASADPLGEILSLARRVGYWSGDVVPRRPAPSFVVRDDDFRYGPGGGLSSYAYDGRPYANPRSRWEYVRSNSAASAGEELLQMNYRLLRSVARASSADFDRWLTSIPAGEVWRKHFDLRSIQEFLAPDVDVPPTADEREVIVRILGIFDRAVANSDLDQITRIDSARTLHAALRELATPPDQRLIRRLSLSTRSLNRSLDAFSTGVTWQRYLALPDGIIAAADRPPGAAVPAPEVDLETLGQILERYDSVSRSEQYRAIAYLPEFQATHQRLTELVNPPPDAPPSLPTAVAEELPPPELETR